MSANYRQPGIFPISPNRRKEHDRTMITTLIAMTAAWVLLLATLAQPRRPLLDYLVAATLLFAGCLGAAIYLGVM